MPFIVPTTPFSAGARGGTTVLYGALAPTQAGSISRLGASIAAYPPVGIITCSTGWGFVAGVAPPGTTTLTVTADGSTIERAGAAALFGNASAYCELYIDVEEFVHPLAPVDLPVDPSTFGPPGSGAEISNPLAGREFARSSHTWRMIIWHSTAGVGVQVLHRDYYARITALLPIIPGNAYRCWVGAYQAVACHSPLTPAGWAYCNFTYDFGPIFYAFTS